MSQNLDKHNLPHPGGPVPHDPRAWLDHFPAHRRSTASGWFHEAVRKGAQTPHAVCSAVWQTVQQRLQWSSDLHKRQFLQDAADVLQREPDAALAYAAHVIAYEALPYAKRQRVKGQRALAYAMAGKEPTQAQLSYLAALGYRGDPPADRAAASTLIDALRREGGAR